MLYVIVGSLLILFGVMAMLKRATQAPMPQGKIATLGSAIGGPVLGVLLILAGLGVLASTSFVLIGADRVGHLKRIYLADDLPPGRIIAVDGQKGPQAEILGPGFHFRPLLNVLYDVEERAVVTIPRRLLRPDHYSRRPANARRHVHRAGDCRRQAEHHARSRDLHPGRRLPGPQETVLKPGSYRFNQYLFDVRIDESNTAANRDSHRPGGVVKVERSSSPASTARKRWCGFPRRSTIPTPSRCRWCPRAASACGARRCCPAPIT